MMIVVNKEKVKKMLRRGLAFALVIGLAAGYRVVNPGPESVKTMGADGEVTNWGLSFDKEGEPPVGNASAGDLAKYDAWYVGDTGKKTIYLTFDAGYENGYTAEILDVLKSHQVPAAFFLVGTYIRDNPDLVKRMAEEGHIVGNHSMNHRDMSAVTDMAVFEKELAEVEIAYQSAIDDAADADNGASPDKGKSGEKKVKMPRYYRPPEGKFSPNNLEMAKKLGYKTIFWSLAYVDWNTDRQPTREEALNTLLPRTHNGAVILLHSTSKTNAKVLGELIERWKTEGYRFGTLDELTKSAIE
ncbi:MAG: polysaccharide deacetylase family protein [Firmicutes bacterium]|nr:polysaccharide deacetylase family protein [Bacillota bacterium]